MNPERFDSPVKRLVVELKPLRHGRGLHDERIADRVGGMARMVLGIGADDVPEVVQTKAFSALRWVVSALPPPQRDALTAAFGLDSDLPHYQDRLARVAEDHGVTTRTVRRWVEAGLHSTATALMRSRQGDVAAGWWTDRVVVAVALHRPQIEVLEVRRVVAAIDGLEALDLDQAGGVSPGTGFDAFYGGTLLEVEDPARPRVVLKLPKTLGRGETHEFALHTRLPTGHHLMQHLCVPRHRCDSIDLWVRFPVDRRPRRVTRLADVPSRDLDLAGGSDVVVDGTGRVHVSFGGPAVGRVSGLRWNYS
ncbi:MAG: hypothetical protein HOY78_28310 [Saccharothrix sp.]|nr:hypothetical protein [Saccharothrix sp.]